MATILSQVGWRTTLLAGGYKTYRRHVTARLYDSEAALKVVLLDGNTGSGKTEVLQHLAVLGAQVIDLESRAGHRGSLFGGFAAHPQPSQKMFESRLLAALDAVDPNRPVIVEAESSKVGERMVPPALWQAMPPPAARKPAFQARASYRSGPIATSPTLPARCHDGAVGARRKCLRWRQLAAAKFS